LRRKKAIGAKGTEKCFPGGQRKKKRKEKNKEKKIGLDTVIKRGDFPRRLRHKGSPSRIRERKHKFPRGRTDSRRRFWGGCSGEPARESQKTERERD